MEQSALIDVEDPAEQLLNKGVADEVGAPSESPGKAGGIEMQSIEGSINNEGEPLAEREKAGSE